MHPKIRASALAGSCTVLIVYALSLAHVTVPGDVAAAATTIISAFIGQTYGRESA